MFEKDFLTVLNPYVLASIKYIHYDLVSDAQYSRWFQELVQLSAVLKSQKTRLPNLELVAVKGFLGNIRLSNNDVQTMSDDNIWALIDKEGRFEGIETAFTRSRSTRSGGGCALNKWHIERQASLTTTRGSYWWLGDEKLVFSKPTEEELESGEDGPDPPPMVKLRKL
jgi:hypothetical protein